MEDCLKNIIKLSRTTCECFEDGKPEDYNEGQSEIYLDELEGLDLKLVGSVADCEEDGLWTLMNWAREEATKAFKADFLSCISTNYMPKRPVFSGVVGQTTFTGSLSLSGTKAGVKYVPQQIRGGTMKVRRIGLALNVSTSVDVDVYDNDLHKTTPLGSYTINSIANTVEYAELSTPLILPQWSNNVSRLEYYFVYSRSGFQPKDNKNDCDCGGTSSKPVWTNWVKVQGINGSGNSYENFDTTKYVNGVLLDVDLRCQTSEIICSDTNPLDFDNDGWAMQVGYAIRWKAGELLLEKILNSDQLNRYTMMDRDKTYGKRNHARKLYGEFIVYLCDNKEVVSDCLMCKPNPNFSMGNVIA